MQEQEKTATTKLLLTCVARLDYGLDEVLEEEELKVLFAYRNQFEQEKADTNTDVQRMEEEALRFNEEKEKRLNAERARLKKEQELTKKLASMAKARQFLSNLTNTTTAELMGWVLHFAASLLRVCLVCCDNRFYCSCLLL
mmetsp:Transcript_20777/g.41149  ORF Transcript_20777/g.41149 Transcript_20777/m.41149 type:complete len:141 (+) Transcript_20777:848-1270(+)